MYNTTWQTCNIISMAQKIILFQNINDVSFSTYDVMMWNTYDLHFN
jgi:hypothetical protein